MSFNSHQWYLNGLKKVGANNTFIGGVASVINTPALLAAKLRNYPSGTSFSTANIYNFTIVGSDIECYIGVDYQLFQQAFYLNTSIIYYKDYENYLKQLNNQCFLAAANLENIQMEGIITVSGVDVISQTKVSQIILPNCTSISSQAFKHPAFKTRLIFPRCLTLGATVGNDSVFAGTTNINASTKLYVPIELQTNNGGLPDGDVSFVSGLGGMITYVPNYTAPSAITNLTIGTITATTLQLNFTPPSSLNTIDFYEVWLNGVRTDKTVTASGQYIIGLTPNTPYTIELKPVDIFYNKSTSNTVTQTTSATYVIPTANLVSYYKMEGNVLDSWGANNGTPTAITYASGLVGQGAVFNGTTSKIVTANSTNLQLANGSIAVVVKASAAGSSYRGIVVKQLAYGLFLVDGVLGSYSWGGTVGYRTTGINLNDGLNHIIVMTFQSGVTNGTKIYLDNVLVLTTTITVLNQTQGLTIGAGDTVGSQWINAQIDEPAIFNSILTAGEVSEITAKLNSGQSLI